VRTLFSIFYLLFVLAVAIVTVVVLGVVLLVTIPFDGERTVLHWFTTLYAKLLFFWSPYWHLEIEGTEHVDPKKAYVITINHQSYMDIPLMYFVPRLNFKWVSKYEVRQIPIFGLVLRLHDDITIKRGKASAAIDLMEKGSKHLAKGTSIMIFPEGTRSKDMQIHLYKEGAFRLAKAAGVEILPCVIDGTRTAFDRRGLCKNTFSIRFMEPVSLEHIAASEPRTLAEEVQALSAANLRQIREREKNSGK